MPKGGMTYDKRHFCRKNILHCYCLITIEACNNKGAVLGPNQAHGMGF